MDPNANRWPGQHPTYLTAGPPKPQRIGLWVGFAAGTALLLAVGGATAGYLLLRPDPKVNISGVLILRDTDPSVANFTWDVDPPTCTGDQQYDDIIEGASVTITTTNGTIIGVGRLGPGRPAAVETVEAGGLIGTFEAARECRFSFDVTGLPSERFYGIEVTHRDRANYSRDQAVSGVEISLGH